MRSNAALAYGVLEELRDTSIVIDGHLRRVKLAQTAIGYPPMQTNASFNVDAVKKKIAESKAAHAH